MARILMIQWSGSAYDSLRYLLDLVGAELSEDGHHLERVVIGQDGWPERLQNLMTSHGPWHMALGMSGVGLEVGPNTAESVWDLAKIPFFTWFCDHPAHFPARHTRRSPFAILGYVFPDHARYARDHLNANGTTYAVHLGLPRRSLFMDPRRPVDRRNGRIAFFKSGGDENAMRATWRQTLPPTLATVLEEAAEACHGADVAAMLPRLQQAAERHGLFLAPDGTLCLTLLHHLDFYERARRSTLLMRSLLDLPVDVYGADWGHIDWSGKRAVHRPPLTFPDMMARLPAYLGSLSLNPLVSESVHDRLPFALAAGVVPLGDRNWFSRQHMPDLDRYSFEFTPQSIAAAAEALLADPQAALDAAEATYQALLPHFTLRHTARQIIEFCSLHGMNMKA
ncbi:MAG: hypothetical protein U1E70_18710 [Acetobacteraceae bacterium]